MQKQRVSSLISDKTIKNINPTSANLSTPEQLPVVTTEQLPASILAQELLPIDTEQVTTPLDTISSSTEISKKNLEQLPVPLDQPNFPTMVEHFPKELPVLAEDSGFRKYLQEINKFPILTLEEEQEYAQRVSRYKDKNAAKLLVASHLRLVIKIAQTYRGYGLPIRDMVFEGNVGLLKAVNKFDYTLGNRFATYAIWWIKAAIQEYILKSWSLVKICTTSAQKRLFFNLNRLKNRIFAHSGKSQTYLNEHDISTIAKELDTSTKTVKQMVNRLDQGDISLNSRYQSDEEESIELGDTIMDEHSNQELLLTEQEEKSLHRQLLNAAIKTLNAREKDILLSRKLRDKSITLEDLSQKYHISRERVRQIEENTIRKLREYFAKNSQ